MASTLVQAYFASGLIAARPAMPLVAPSIICFYAATDNGHVYLWTGVGWVTLL